MESEKRENLRLKVKEREKNCDIANENENDTQVPTKSSIYFPSSNCLASIFCVCVCVQKTALRYMCGHVQNVMRICQLFPFI